MFRSIRFKMTTVLILILGGVLIIAYMINYLFSESYYLNREKKHLLDTYNQVRQTIDEGGDPETIEKILKEVSMESNIRAFTIQITDDNLEFHDSEGDLKNFMPVDREMYQYIENIFRYEDLRVWLLDGDESAKENLVAMLRDSEDETDQEILELVTNGYFITDSKDGGRFNKGLYLIGYSPAKYLVTMRIPLADIRQSAAVSRQLMLRIGLVGILIGCIIMFSYASTFTKPIKEIAAASEEMSELNFDVKVRTNRKDEIGMLGRSIDRMSEQLEQTVADLKLANIELQKDIEKKEQIDEMRKDFLSHVSHELKTPIALIQGYAEGLKENINEDEESRNFYCDVISDEAAKMNNLVRKLLNLNQIEFGNNTLDMRRFDLYQLIFNKIAASNILFEKKGVKVVFDESGPTYVWADELMIEEAFSNYLSNALNHVPDGGKIRIYFQQDEKNLRLHVFNQGKPIPAEDIDKIWIKFYKVDKARTREYGGSGIGLSLVAATMEAHGKSYGVDNMEDGVDFWFDLDRENL